MRVNLSYSPQVQILPQEDVDGEFSCPCMGGLRLLTTMAPDFPVVDLSGTVALVFCGGGVPSYSPSRAYRHDRSSAVVSAAPHPSQCDNRCGNRGRRGVGGGSHSREAHQPAAPCPLTHVPLLQQGCIRCVRNSLHHDQSLRHIMSHAETLHWKTWPTRVTTLSRMVTNRTWPLVFGARLFA